MVCGRFELDPETGLRFLGRLDNVVETLFHTAVPDTCPTGDGKQDHLRALALVRLVDGNVVADGDLERVDTRADICVHIDLQTMMSGLHATSVIDCGRDIELPVESYRRLACIHGVIPIVLNSDGVVVDMGRRTRFANRAQRRALRAMYKTCPIPGCTVDSRHCQPHHIHYWRNMGLTDLDNLVPLCSKHHHLVHEGGWKLTMAPNRALTITYPDGTIQTTGPPAATRARAS
jgi:hypothetical protein